MTDDMPTGAYGSVPLTPFRVSEEKTVIPDAPPGALERTGLAERLDPALRRITVFVGPGGFGKTTLLADCCRRAALRGDRVIWLSVDENDDGARVVAHLAHGADLEWDVGVVGAPQDTARHHLDGLLNAIRSEGQRWILALDELERIPESGARIIDYLIWRGPANLHLALACRQLPRTIDIATPVAEGRGVAVGPDELRFTLPEFREFFDRDLSRERLQVLWDDSHGWPIAACLQRNLEKVGKGTSTDLSLNWVAARLMRGVSNADRIFLLEAACFEWTDEEVFDEVLGVGATARLWRLPLLRGLVQRLDGGNTFRLHPLIRRHAQIELEGTAGSRAFHRRLAGALAVRGRTVDAMRHALLADDVVLAGEIFEDAGAVRLVLTSGVRGLQEAVDLFPRDVTGYSPRLRLARLAASSTGGSILASTDYPTAFLPANPESEDVGSGADALYYDTLIVRGILLMCGCAPADSHRVRSTLKEYGQALVLPNMDPVVAGGLWYGEGVYRYELGELDDSLAAVRKVRGYATACPSVAVSARTLEGAILFARGDAEESEVVLVSAQRAARHEFAGHESPDLMALTFSAEAALETGRLGAANRRVPTLAKLSDAGAWLDVYAAVVDVRVSLALRAGFSARAFGILDEAGEFGRARCLTTFVRWLSAIRITTLVRIGRVDEASVLWRETGFLEDHWETGLTWRETEAVFCARMRLLCARGECDAALAVGRRFAAWARDGGLRRCQSWATALSMKAAWLGGDSAAAEEYLVENLRVFRQTGFSRALVEQETSFPVLLSVEFDDPELNEAKERILEMLPTLGEENEKLVLSEREVEVLARLSTPDKEIARALGLTRDGVRYHIKKLLRKLGSPNRVEAMRRARRLGILPPPPASRT